MPRHKAGDRPGWASLAPEPEDKENRVPALAPVGKRRQKHSSDSILQEQNGKGKQRRTSAKAGKASEEAPVSKPPFNDDEEFDANLAAELEVEGDEEFDANLAAKLEAKGDKGFDANLAAELEADNDISDEEGIPSPDEIETKGDEEFDANLAAELEADDNVGDEEYVPSPDGIEDDFFMDSVNHKTTQKARVELPEATLASASEDKENRVHDSEPTPARKRRRAKGSDSILQEHGKGKRKLSHIEEDVAPSEGVSTSTPPSTDDKESDAIQRDNLDAEIDAEIDALLDNEIDDDEIEVIGDDDIIVSPDDIDEEDFVSEVKTEPTTILGPTTVADGKFAVILRKTISQLVDWAKEHDYTVMSPKDMAVTWGFWRLLCRVSVDFLVDLILPGVPLQVQALFEKETWSLEDLLSLPPAGDDKRQGIYGNFVTGQIKNSESFTQLSTATI
ncbi:hypothetical protein IFM53868_05749 [Aspergillus udagawae]|uniref:Uncharacterized protein n=1 Tax=Aspergillus udagawae TaxID=91492 RepID=A0ABQ1AW54_9EURO|nr:hypothetical protein IFM53868_05749 [Aspergillus udagawae]